MWILDTAFHLFATPVSWLEAIAFALAVINISCNVLEIHWGWPLAITASGLYAWFFVHSGIYGEAGVNLFFVVMATWGWWQWLRGHRAHSTAPLQVARLPRTQWGWLALAWALLWGLCGLGLHHLTDSTVPWWDGFVTAGSIVGTLLLGRKLIENWPVWVLVNIVSIGLFWYKDLALTTLLYVLLLGLGLLGWHQWHRKLAPA